MLFMSFEQSELDMLTPILINGDISNIILLVLCLYEKLLGFEQENIGYL